MNIFISIFFYSQIELIVKGDVMFNSQITKWCAIVIWVTKVSVRWEENKIVFKTIGTSRMKYINWIDLANTCNQTLKSTSDECVRALLYSKLSKSKRLQCIYTEQMVINSVFIARTLYNNAHGSILVLCVCLCLRANICVKIGLSV